MYQKPTVPRSIGGTLDDAVQLFKASFSRSWLPALLNGLIITVLAVYQLSKLPVNSSTGALDFQAMVTRNLAGSPASALTSLLSALIELVFYGVIIYITAATTRGESPPLGTSLSAALKRTPAMIGASIVFLIIFSIGLGIAAVPLIYFAGIASRAGGMTATMVPLAATMFLISLVLSLPVLYVAGRMMLYLVALICESLGPMRSIATSWRLIGGNWWRTVTIVFVMGLIIYILTLVLVGFAGAAAALAGGVSSGVTAAGVTRTFGIVALVGAIMGGLIRIISVPLMAGVFVAVFQDLRLRKGGGDLQARLGALAKG